MKAAYWRDVIDGLHFQAMLGHASMDMVQHYTSMVDNGLLYAHRTIHKLITCLTYTRLSPRWWWRWFFLFSFFTFFFFFFFFAFFTIFFFFIFFCFCLRCHWSYSFQYECNTITIQQIQFSDKSYFLLRWHCLGFSSFSFHLNQSLISSMPVTSRILTICVLITGPNSWPLGHAPALR